MGEWLAFARSDRFGGFIDRRKTPRTEPGVLNGVRIPYAEPQAMVRSEATRREETLPGNGQQ